MLRRINEYFVLCETVLLAVIHYLQKHLLSLNMLNAIRITDDDRHKFNIME